MIDIQVIKQNGPHDDNTGKESYMSELELKASLSLDNYDLTNCYLCNKNFILDSEEEVLIHMSSHYKLELQRTYIDRPDSTWRSNNKCPKCDKYVQCPDAFVMHIGVTHQQVLQYIPERLKNTFIKAKVVKDSPLICPLEHCDRSCETRQKLLLHLLMNHYEEKLMKDFGEAFETDDGQCLICDRKLPSNKTGYLKHIGVEHELVIEYLEKDASVRYIPLEIYQTQSNLSTNKNGCINEDKRAQIFNTNLSHPVDENAKPVNNIRSCLDSDSE
eukprot:GFUD01034071.1.p1 GENE.GFUD01034071.1~~GFUD01034071.1.p1  ORF type:complete len:282 (-),score=49.53 GFUD01034071.1:2-820(-)